MTAVAHDAVAGAARAALLAAPAIAGGRVERARTRPIDEAFAQFVGVSVAGSTPQRAAILAAPVEWTTDLRAWCWARGTPATPLAAAITGEQAALGLYAQVYARLQADITLGGAAWDVEPGAIAVDSDDQDVSLGCVVASFRIRHRTQGGTLEV